MKKYTSQGKAVELKTSFIQVGGVSRKLRAGQTHHAIELHQKLHPLRRQGGYSQVHYYSILRLKSTN
jgi:hypothetical protein